jgi:hypothetical protein
VEALAYYFLLLGFSGFHGDLYQANSVDRWKISPSIPILNLKHGKIFLKFFRAFIYCQIFYLLLYNNKNMEIKKKFKPNQGYRVDMERKHGLMTDRFDGRQVWRIER